MSYTIGKVVIKGSEHNSSELFLFEAAEIPDHKQAKGFHLL